MSSFLESYESFLAQKRVESPVRGITAAPALSSSLFPFQRDVVNWALLVGCAGIYAECGLGKGWMALEWARVVAEHTGGRVLVLAPLAVAQQFVREAAKLGVEVTYCKTQDDVPARGIAITNYERLEAFDPSAFSGVVLDESSILKAYTGATKRRILEAFARTPFRLACSATPAPNDHLELGNQSEFLGVLTSHEMFARWFLPDTSTFGTYRVKGHAVEAFWDWVASWARCFGHPADLGYTDARYTLPELQLHRHVIDVDVVDGRGEALFRLPDLSATAVHAEKRRTVGARAKKIAELVENEPNEDWLIWCDTDYEADALKEVIPDAVEVRGSDSSDWKENAAEWFQGYEPRCTCRSATNGARTTAATTAPIEGSGSSTAPTRTPATPSDDSATPTTKSSARKSARRSKTGNVATPTSDSLNGSSPTASPSTSIDACSPRATEGASSADAIATSTTDQANEPRDSISTTATAPSACEASSARPATSDSGSSPTTPSGSSVRRCTCGASLFATRKRRILISKSRIFGFGLNFQSCARVAFVGASYSYEAFYQAVRRSWRFGQTRPVDVHVAMASTELALWDVLAGKRDGHDLMKRHMQAAMRRAHAREDRGAKDYQPSHVGRLPSWLHEQGERP